MNVYVVMHEHDLEDRDDIKFIGVYSSEESAAAAVGRISKQPGFCDSKLGFTIDKYEVDKDQWIEGFTTVK